jgi:hypothetical protein
VFRESPPKDPVKVAAGVAGAAARWGVPVRVRLDDFDPDERAAIHAAIAAKRAAKAVRAERETAAAEVQHPATAGREGTHDASPVD